ncbi:hypothetical protein L3X38_020039 [Prunus dulcis]|uniref:Uncharacterized protein n=1 Tax=Prunus dulcis TaxID=3755 RepID=A0AAD4ZCA8_PRUDU|nr:hypothetical protein L3X38_020039 [Prunus dulcis]
MVRCNKAFDIISQFVVSLQHMPSREVKVGALHKVPMWDFVQAVVVATRVLEIRFGIWELRQVSGTSEVCLPSAWEKAWLPWC